MPALPYREPRIALDIHEVTGVEYPAEEAHADPNGRVFSEGAIFPHAVLAWVRPERRFLYGVQLSIPAASAHPTAHRNRGPEASRCLA